MIVKPNPQCGDSWCRKRQAEYQEKLANQPKVEKIEEPEEEAVIHEDNEWGNFFSPDLILSTIYLFVKK